MYMYNVSFFLSTNNMIYAVSEISLIERSSSNIHCMHKGLRAWPGNAVGIGGELAGTL